MELTQEYIEKKIAELTQQRDTFVLQANQQISALNGALAAYQELLSIIAPAAEKRLPQRHRHKQINPLNAPQPIISVKPVKPV